MEQIETELSEWLATPGYSPLLAKPAFNTVYVSMLPHTTTFIKERERVR